MPTALNRIIEALSDILKYSLQKHNVHGHAERRNRISEKIRSHPAVPVRGQIHLYYDYEEELESTPIIRLILQPLIENSLYHGIKPLDGSGFYQVKDHGTG